MSNRVFILEDHQPTLSSLMKSVSQDPRLEVCGTATTLAQAQDWFSSNPPPDAALVDLGLPDGRGEMLISNISHSVSVLVMTVFADETAVVSALKAGAIGYLLKERHGTDITDAIIDVINGGSPISPTIARYLLKHFASERDDLVLDNPLTKRETQVLSLVVKGLSYQEIAQHMSLSIHTIGTHIQNIYRKLSVTSRSEAVYEAVQLGLIDIRT